MALFQYKARGSRGDAVEGTIEAASSDAAAARLMEGGLTPVDIVMATETKRAGGLNRDLSEIFPPKVGLADLIQFSRQMHSLLRAGVPILTALTGLAGNTRNPTLAKAIADINTSLGAGRDLASSLSQHPEIFSLFYVSLVRVGETTGQLDEIFEQLGFYLEREKHTKEQVKSALRYPTFVLTAIAIAIVIINIFVIPAFATTFARFGADLPLATRGLMGLSSFMVNHWPGLLIGLLAAFFGLRHWLRTPQGRYRWHKLQLHLPLIGPVLYQATMARFSHLFSMAQRSGVPLITALSVVAKALDNDYAEERILTMRDGIERGDSITRTATASGVFDPLVLQMLAVGEESGNLDQLLQEIADYYNREVDYAITRLSAAIEPILTIVIGLLVLVLAIGVFLPMWNLGSAVMQR
ncbi:MAG: type II secretion system F family protein [Gammaproteobacteria bacterium]|nr:type II secretion system F family protein [Gammaproteobacteria bacterium]